MSKITLACVVMFFVCNCGTTATIKRADGSSVEARITRSDKDSLYIGLANGKGNQSIPWTEIADIDHPGNGAGVTGVILTAYGILNIAVGLKGCSNTEEGKGSAYCVGVVTPAAVGLGLMLYGFPIWARSKKAATPKDEVLSSAPPVIVLPFVSNVDGEKFKGLMLSTRF